MVLMRLRHWLNVGLFTALSVTILSAKTIYVNGNLTTGNNDGTSWADAYRGSQALHLGLSQALADDEVWVAAGTYKPSAPPPTFSATDSRDFTFYLKDGVKVYGGFNGTETSIAARTHLAPTILSGDIDNNGLLDAGNVCHVVLYSTRVSGNTGTRLDGLTITGGFSQNFFGTIFVTASNISKSQGSGLYAVHGRLNLNNVKISGNSTAQYGGGLFAYFTEVLAENTIFEQNLADNDGGGAFLINATGQFSNCTFLNNRATSNGGGLTVLQGRFDLTQNRFQDNQAGFYGGGLFSSGNILTCTDNIWWTNRSSNLGGGVYTAGDSIWLTNPIFASNTAAAGGGLYANNATIAMLRHATFFNNNATTQGGGLMTDGGTVVTVWNSIFWSNKKNSVTTAAGADYVRLSGTNVFRYSGLQFSSTQYSRTGTGTYDIGMMAENNIFGVNPLFTNILDLDGADGIWRTADDGLTLQNGSPCLNVGFSEGPSKDIRGATRTDRPDLGAYERGATLPVSFLAFWGQYTEGGHLLRWKTADEQHNKGFWVEKRQANGDWYTLGFVSAQLTKTYAFETPTMGADWAYYRLRQEDFDGSYHFSKILALKSIAASVRVFPNPTQNDIKAEGHGHYALYNAQGQLLEHGIWEGGLSVARWPAGRYWLHLNNHIVPFDKF